MKFALKIYIHVKCKYFFLGLNPFPFSDHKDFLKLLAWKYSEQAGEQTVQHQKDRLQEIEMKIWEESDHQMV